MTNDARATESALASRAEVDVEGSARQRVDLRQAGPPYQRIGPATLDAFSDISAATAAATLHKIGLTRSYVQGPTALMSGAKVVGSALTLAFMPKREDVAAAQGQENFEKKTALWAVLDAVEPFDVLVVQAFGDPLTGCIGEMLVRYLAARGGLGVVVDGCVRDSPKLRQLGVPIWATGVTPHYATQGGLIPWAYQVPVACGGVLVLPGDLVVADDDGAVIVPAQLADHTARLASVHEDWEEFSRKRLEEGGLLSKYYPLDDDATAEYHLWRERQASSGSELPPAADDDA